MNPESPTDPRQALEVSLTALVLGELPPDQAEFLRRTMAQDPELTRTYERLRQTIELVRETEKSPAQQPATTPDPPRLSEDRRQELLQQFKTVAPKEFEEPRPASFSWLVPVGIAAVLMLLVGSMLLPALSRAKSKSSAVTTLAARRVATEQMLAREDADRSSLGLVQERLAPAPKIASPATEVVIQPPKTTIVLPAATAETQPAETITAGASAYGGYFYKAAPMGEPTSHAFTPDSSVAFFNGRSPSKSLWVSENFFATMGEAAQAQSKVASSERGRPAEQAAGTLTVPRVNVAGGGGLTGGIGGGGGLGGGGLGGGKPGSGSAAQFRNYYTFSQPQTAPPTAATTVDAGAMRMRYGLVPGADTAGKSRLGESGANLATTGSEGAIDPATGLPVAAAKPVAAIDPATGLPTLAAVDTLAVEGRQAGDAVIRGERKQQERLPVLGDLPAVGQLFRNNGIAESPQFQASKGEAQTAQTKQVLIEAHLLESSASPSPALQEKAAAAEAVSRSRALVVQAPPQGAPTSESRSKQESARGMAGVSISTNAAGYGLPQEENKVLGRRLSDSRERLVEMENAASKPVNEGVTTVVPPAQEAAGRLSATVTGAKPPEPAGVVSSLNIVGYVNQPAPGGQSASAFVQITNASEASLAYRDGKRQLDELTQFRNVLQAKLGAEGTDRTLPKSGLVEIVDRADADSAAPSLGVRLRRAFTGGVEKKARIKIEKDSTYIGELANAKVPADLYDPYVVQTEGEVIRSDAVLGKVVDDLKLDEAWGRQDGRSESLSKAEAVQRLRSMLDVKNVPNSSLVDIGVKSDQPDDAAKLANTVAEKYRDYRNEERIKLSMGGIEALGKSLSDTDKRIALEKEKLARLEQKVERKQNDEPPPKPVVPPPIPQPEVDTRENAFSTFSLNVSDVSFKTAAASLEKGLMPEPASIRSEEFINAFDYRDPEPAPGMPVGFCWDRARYPFAQNRDMLRFSIKTAAQGRQAGQPLNLVLLLDNSGSMERADRVRIIREALKVLAGQLQPQDKLSVVTFARTAQLRVDGVPGNQAGQPLEEISGLTPQGGTNLEEAMNLAYQTALKHYLANGINRVVLLTDGAANLGDVNPENLKKKVEDHRKQGIAFDCFGIGWEGYNDDLLEVLSRNGDGRYGFINTPEEASTEFAAQLAGALHVAASDVKVQVEFNPKRVTAWRQIGYAKHQLTKEQFRDNTVDAAEIGAAESGNALYVVEVNPRGEGPLATVRVRYKLPGTTDYREHEWTVLYYGGAAPLERSSPAMRLATSASAFSEWLASNPYAAEVTPDALLQYVSGVPDVYGADPRPKRLEWMIRQAKSVAGK